MLYPTKMGKRFLGYRYILALPILLLVSACTPITGTTQDLTATRLELEDCQLSTPGVAIRLEAHCGKLSVPENPNQPQGKQIDLNLAVLPAVSRSPAPDPIFFIPGGPGEAATETYLGLSGAFELLNQKRDIVLVDQRGTGGSNPLECDIPEIEGENSENIDTYLLKCLDELDADPRLYTTAIAMDDLDQVRQVLGYDQINIYGASYGTRAALAYLRQHPEHVRSVILDGVVPPDWVLGPSVANDAQNALDSLFGRGAADKSCNNEFRNLKQGFQTVLTELDQGPVTVVLDDPVNGEPTTIFMTRESFANTIHLLSYTPETAALIPLLVHTTIVENDFRRITAIASSYEALLGASLSSGMRFSVICSEDAPYFHQTPESSGYLEEWIVDAFENICSVWPRGQIPADFRQPVQSGVPVLLLSGEFDPVTPPENAEMAMRNLSNSIHLVAPGMGHINLFRGCIPRLATQFIETGTLQGLDATCVQHIQPSPFFINFNGPLP